VTIQELEEKSETSERGEEVRNASGIYSE